jgi:hypothetical protein
MYVVMTHKATPNLSFEFLVCECCKADSPHVPCKAREEAKLKGWKVHNEPVKTAVRKKFTGRWVEQYFCPKCADKVGTVPAVDRRSKKRAAAKAAT